MQSSYKTSSRAVKLHNEYFNLFSAEDDTLEARDPEGISVVTRLARLLQDTDLRQVAEDAYKRGIRVLRARKAGDLPRAQFDKKSGQVVNCGWLESYGQALRVAPLKATGRPAYCPLMMFKLILAATASKFSDKRASLELHNNRLWQIFCNVADGTKIPRATIHRYREIFTVSGFFEELAWNFIDKLETEGWIKRSNEVAADGSYVDCRRQHVSKAVRKLIDEGKGDECWQDQPAVKRQMDIDARWGAKGTEKHFGYKMHALADIVHKFLLHCTTAPANLHDSQAVPALVGESEEGRRFFADSAYVGPVVKKALDLFNITPMICAKAYRNRPLTEEQVLSNREKARRRSRIEHIFGTVEGTLGGPFCRWIGIERANSYNFAVMFIYNLLRFEQILRLQLDDKLKESTA